jgi:5-methylcytosine-specific restriction protein A
MSNNRLSVSAGWVDPRALPKGPNGRAICRWIECGNEVPKGRRTFCSDQCVHEHKFRSQPGYLRECVFARDKGVCAVCGVDCDKVKRVFRSLVKKAGLKRWKWPDTIIQNPERYGALDMFRQQFPWFRPYLSAWAADHILPVIEGGGECGIENIRTLCLGCHNAATAELRERLKNRKAQARQSADHQQLEQAQ